MTGKQGIESKNVFKANGPTESSKTETRDDFEDYETVG